MVKLGEGQIIRESRMRLKPNGTHDSQGRCPWLYYFAPKGLKNLAPTGRIIKARGNAPGLLTQPKFLSCVPLG
ncbi:MAG: hypothetical protein DRR19_28230 [Candidatus Parabeggiatoa sp. nov. 1]|nr:MAG: hypothetical protein DRR19_28230 [Gammaproteobacteria bacterium]